MINLQQLQCFHVMAEYENYTRAAEALFMSQSTLSYTIGTLEKELGVPLFEKQGKRVHLTAYGKKYQDYCERILELANEGKQALTEMVDPLQGTVKIGHYPSLLNGLFSDMIDQFTQTPEYRNIRLHLFPASSLEAMDMLQDGKADVIFCQKITAGNINSIRMFSDRLVLLVSEDHPLANEEAIDLTEVSDDTLILLANSPRMRRDQEQSIESVGFQPRAIIEANKFTDAMSMVAAGLGVALTPMRQDIGNYRIRSVNLKNGNFNREIYLSYLSEKAQRPVVKTFIRFAEDYGKQLEKGKS